MVLRKYPIEVESVVSIHNEIYSFIVSLIKSKILCIHIMIILITSPNREVLFHKIGNAMNFEILMKTILQ